MKLKQWLYGAAALALLAACSDKDIAPGTENGENRDPDFASGVSYLGVSIELPTTPTTRGDDGSQGNDNFDDGTPSEYNVDNAAILLFFGAQEESAEFVGAYTLLEDETTNDPSDDNITTSFHRTIQVLNKPVKTGNEKLWGLAIVNYRDGKDCHFELGTDIEKPGTYGNLTLKATLAKVKDDNGKATFTTTDKSLVRLKDKKTGVTPTTFSEFRGYITDCEFLQTRANNTLKSIFMTNAPLSNKPGTKTPPIDLTIQTLSELKYDNFKSTQVEAQQNPAGCIFVERAVAKITCSDFPASTILSHAIVDADGNMKDEKIRLTIENVGWAIDNDETTSYIVRNAKTSNDFWNYSSNNSVANRLSYRFIGDVEMNTITDDNGNHKWYRTYWCEDPNYSTDKPLSTRATEDENVYKSLAKATIGDESSFKSTASVTLYPHENTFSVENQNYMNTTRVIFRVQYSTEAEIQNGETWKKMDGDCNLYAIRGQLKNFYLEQDAKNLLDRGVLGSNEISELVRDYKKKDITVKVNRNSLNISYGIAKNNIEDQSIKKGDYIITSISFKSDFIQDNFEFTDEKTAKTLQDALDEIKDSANGANHIVPFTKNVCYYAVYIQHFGDTYCNLPDNWKGDKTEIVYEGNDEEKYLGRYGLVRNNWYDLQIRSIGRLGNAKVPDIEEDKTSDDNKLEEWYLSARIHVLSWAKRTQHHDF